MANNWAKYNARQTAEARGIYENSRGKGLVSGHVVNPDGSTGPLRRYAGRDAVQGDPRLEGDVAYGKLLGAITGSVAVSVHWDGLARIRERLERAVRFSPAAVALALNRTADVARTGMTRALVKQTGIKFGTIRKATSIWRASAGSLSAEIKMRGGYTSLTEFGARRTKKGVSAAPWGHRRVFPSTFIVKRYGGHVYRRAGKERFPIEKLYGPALHVEMVKGQSAEAFAKAVAKELPKRLDHELDRVLGL